MKKIAFTACAVLFLFNVKGYAQKNLLNNGGFEDELYSWNSGNAKITPWDHAAGKSSCAITAINNSNWVGIDQMVRIPKNVQGLDFSAWLKTINVVKGNDEWMGAIYNVEFLDKADKKLGDGANIARLTGDNNWEQYKKSVKVPAGAVSFKVLIAMGYATGTMLADEVVVKALSADEVAKL